MSQSNNTAPEYDEWRMRKGLSLGPWKWGTEEESGNLMLWPDPEHFQSTFPILKTKGIYSPNPHQHRIEPTEPESEKD